VQQEIKVSSQLVNYCKVEDATPASAAIPTNGNLGVRDYLRR